MDASPAILNTIDNIGRAHEWARPQSGIHLVVTGLDQLAASAERCTAAFKALLVWSEENPDLID